MTITNKQQPGGPLVLHVSETVTISTSKDCQVLRNLALQLNQLSWQLQTSLEQTEAEGTDNCSITGGGEHHGFSIPTSTEGKKDQTS